MPTSHAWTRVLTLAAVPLFLNSAALASPLHPGAAHARPADLDRKNPARVPVLGSLIANGFKPRFLAHDGPTGLDVWFVTMANHTPRVIYTRPDGCCVFAGNIFERTKAGAMESISARYYIEASTLLASEGVFPTKATPATPATLAAGGGAHAPRTQAPNTSPISGAAVLAALESAHWIEAGKPGAPLLYAVVDPECPYCHAFWQAIRPAVMSGTVRVRLVVTAPLSPENNGRSLADAASILSARDPLGAWNAHIDNPQAPLPAATSVGRKALAANEIMRTSVLEHDGFHGVPLLVYRDRKTGHLGYRLGIAASEVPALVSSVGIIRE